MAPAGAPARAGLRTSIAPNPSAGVVRVSLSLPRNGPLEVDLFDVAGRLARRLWLGPGGPGPLLFDADLARLPGGVYFLRARLGAGGGAPDAVGVRKLLITR